MAPLNQNVRQNPILRGVRPQWLAPDRGVRGGDIQAFREVSSDLCAKAADGFEAAVQQIGPALSDEDRDTLHNNPGGAGLLALCNRGFGLAGLLARFPALAALSGHSADAVRSLCAQRIGYLGAEEELTAQAKTFDLAPLLLGAYGGLVHEAVMAHLDQLLAGKTEVEQARVLAPFRPVLGLVSQEAEAQSSRKDSVRREQTVRQGILDSSEGLRVYERVTAALDAGEEVSDEDLAAAESYLDAAEQERTRDLTRKAALAEKALAKKAKPAKGERRTDNR